MEFKEILNRRYSCKSYNDKEVKNNDVIQILENAILAPNAGNLQAWRFIIIRNEEKKQEVSIACLQQKWMNQASIFIAIAEDLEYVKLHYGKRSDLYCAQDSSLAASNIMSTAASLDLDSCFISAFDEGMLRNALSLPENLKPYCVITIGYGNKKSEEKKRRSLYDFVSFNTYGNKIQSKNSFSLKNKTKKLVKKLTKHTK